MEVIAQLFSAGGWLTGYLVPFLIVLTIVVFFHELGHFLVARWNGVGVEAFSVGFGPELLGFTDSRGTRWKFCAIPLGGYVKFIGDANAASAPDFDRLERMDAAQRAISFEHQPVGRRAAVVAAGPLANFLLAIVIFTASFMFIGRHVSDPVIAEVRAESAAEEAGFLAGDIIRTINGRQIAVFSDVPRIVAPNAGNELVVEVERDGRMLELNVTPREQTITDRFGNPQTVGIMGVTNTDAVGNFRVVKYGFVDALAAGTYETWFIIERTVVYLKDIIVGRQSAEQLGGPIRIAKISGDVATLGASALLNLAAILSVSIGLINLFPIPLLDGGHLVFYAIEALRGRPLSAGAQEVGFRVGMLVILCLVVFTTFNDLNFLSRFL